MIIILPLNPHATMTYVQAYFEADRSAVFVRNGTGKTPLDSLLEYASKLRRITIVETYRRRVFLEHNILPLLFIITSFEYIRRGTLVRFSD